MNGKSAAVPVRKRMIRSLTATTKRFMVIGVAALLATVPAFPQNPQLQEKLAGVKAVIAQNQQKLHQYQWIETTQLTLDGDPKPQKQNSCMYGPDGQVQKTPIGAPAPPPSGGRLKQRIIEKKTEEMQQYMGEVKGVLGMYVPPDPQKMQAAYQAGKMTINPAGGMINLVFTDYAQPGDSMTLTFDSANHKVVSLSVNTYMGQEKDAVTLQVQMASLPDGTNYVQQSILNATAKKLTVTTTNGNYQHL
jgi:hypothetical protein